MARNKPRANIRLRLDRGTLLLKQFGFSSIVCSILDLSEAGCACQIGIKDLSPEQAAAWQQILQPGRVLSVEMTEPQEIRGLTVKEAQVRWVREGRNGALMFGLLLIDLSDEQQSVLGNAMMAFAKDKLRKNTEITPSPMARPTIPAPPVPPGVTKTAVGFPPPPPVPPPPVRATGNTTTFRNPQSAPPVPPPPVPPPQVTATQSGAMRPQVPARPPSSAGVPAARPPSSSGVPAFKAAGSGQAPAVRASGSGSAPGVRGSSGNLPSVGLGAGYSKSEAKDAENFQKQKRHRLVVPVYYQFLGSLGQMLEPEVHKGYTASFNEGGIVIEGPAPSFAAPVELLKMDVGLKVTMQNQPEDMEFICKVRSVEPSPDVRNMFLYGGQFVSISENDRRFIRELYIRAGLTQISRKR